MPHAFVRDEYSDHSSCGGHGKSFQVDDVIDAPDWIYCGSTVKQAFPIPSRQVISSPMVHRELRNDGSLREVAGYELQVIAQPGGAA